jgi:hypothetical protein
MMTAREPLLGNRVAEPVDLLAQHAVWGERWDKALQ